MMISAIQQESETTFGKLLEPVTETFDAIINDMRIAVRRSRHSRKKSLDGEGRLRSDLAGKIQELMEEHQLVLGCIKSFA